MRNDHQNALGVTKCHRYQHPYDYNRYFRIHKNTQWEGKVKQINWRKQKAFNTWNFLTWPLNTFQTIHFQTYKIPQDDTPPPKTSINKNFTSENEICTPHTSKIKPSPSTYFLRHTKLPLMNHNGIFRIEDAPIHTYKDSALNGDK
jgi:hypothetical protein